MQLHTANTIQSQEFASQRIKGQCAGRHFAHSLGRQRELECWQRLERQRESCRQPESVERREPGPVSKLSSFTCLTYREACVCLSHPPSILPISIRCSESAIYFLSLSVPTSHAICRKNFSRSNSSDAFVRYISLLSRVLWLAIKIFRIVSINRASMLDPKLYRVNLSK